MRLGLDESRLDDPAALEAADPGDMLRQVASAAAQVRTAARVVAETDLDALVAEGRPRAVVVTGMGGSGIVGDVLAAVCGPTSPVPVHALRAYRLPGWVGAADLVIAVSCSGRTEETLATAAEAARRGCRLLGVGGADSPLAEQMARVRAPHVALRPVGQPRANLWLLSIPVIYAAARLGLVREPPGLFERLAARLEEVSRACSPWTDVYANPAKALALQLIDTLPMIWGSSALAGVAAYRFASQLAENAKYPAVSGRLPEANHNQVVAFDGPYGAGGGEVDIFRDRVEDTGGSVRLRLVMLRDGEEHPQVTKRRVVSTALAQARGVGVSEVAAEDGHPLERLASLVGPTDYASVYLALAYGIDPTPVTAIEELKARIAAGVAS